MKDENNFGKFVAELRKEKGFTQLQLAELVHVSDKAVSRWENNGGYPDIDTMNKLCDIFDVTLDDLYAAKRISKDLKDKRRRIKKIVIFIVSILIIACLVFGSYFVINYNSVKFYTLSIKNGDFNIRGAYYLDARKRNILQISKLEYLGEKDIDNVYIEIYEKDGIMIYSGVTKDDIFVELAEEIDVDKLHLKVIYSVEEEKIEEDYEIVNIVRYENDELAKNKLESIRQEDIKMKNNNYDIIMKNLGYDLYSNSIYYKDEIVNKYNVKKYYNIETKKFNSQYNLSDEKIIDVEYYGSDNIVFQLKDKKYVILEEFTYNYQNSKVVCLTKRCSKWDKVVEDTKNEIDKLKKAFE